MGLNTRLLRKRHAPRPHAIVRFARIAAGILFVLVGLILSIPGVPGPGSPIVLAGLLVLSADVRIARRALIRLRIAFRRTRKRYLRWRAAP